MVYEIGIHHIHHVSLSMALSNSAKGSPDSWLHLHLCWVSRSHAQPKTTSIFSLQIGEFLYYLFPIGGVWVGLPHDLGREAADRFE